MTSEINHMNCEIVEYINKISNNYNTSFSIESHSYGDKVISTFSYPFSLRIKSGVNFKRDYSYFLENIRQLHCYEIIMDYASIMPLYTESDLILYNELLEIMKMDKNKFVMQFYFKKIKNSKKQKLINIDRYDAYLKGIESPPQNKLMLKFQEKFIEFSNIISNSNSYNNKSKKIEEKIFEKDMYIFKIRIVTEFIDRFEDKVNDVLVKFYDYNELVLIELRNFYKNRFINDLINFNTRRESKDQIIGKNELYSFITSTDKRDIHLNEIKTIVNNTDERIKRIFPIRDDLVLGVKNHPNNELDLSENIAEALYKTKAIKDKNIKLLNLDFGANMQKATFKIPNNINFTDIVKKDEDIGAYIGSDINIVRGNKPNSFTVLIPKKVRDTIYLKDLMSDSMVTNHFNESELPFICGVDLNNNTVVKCLTEAPHLLIAGATNSGKSVFLNTLLVNLALAKSPEELRMFLIDPKKVELVHFEGLPHVEELILEDDKASLMLERLVSEMNHRYDLLSGHKARDIVEYNKKADEKLPYIVCVIEEYNDILISSPEIENPIKRLSQKARASGIHLILITQRPDADVMSGVIKTNFPSRISFKLEGSNEYRTVFGRGIPYKNLLGYGDGVVKYLGQSEDFIRFQSPILTKDKAEEDEIFNNIKNYYSDSVDYHRIEKDNRLSELDKLKDIIIESGETRTVELQRIMKIRINDIVELRKELVKEGFLIKRGNKYEVNDSEY